MTHHHNHGEMQSCIDECTQCSAICLETIQHCLQLGGEHASPSHIALLTTCADICTTSARAMLLGSDAHRLTCAACAEVCAMCAEECARMGDDDAMRRCADACRRCAESCRAMAPM